MVFTMIIQQKDVFFNRGEGEKTEILRFMKKQRYYVSALYFFEIIC